MMHHEGRVAWLGLRLELLGLRLVTSGLGTGRRRVTAIRTVELREA